MLVFVIIQCINWCSYGYQIINFCKEKAFLRMLNIISSSLSIIWIDRMEIETQ